MTTRNLLQGTSWVQVPQRSSAQSPGGLGIKLSLRPWNRLWEGQMYTLCLCLYPNEQPDLILSTQCDCLCSWYDLLSWHHLSLDIYLSLEALVNIVITLYHWKQYYYSACTFHSMHKVASFSVSFLLCFSARDLSSWNWWGWEHRAWELTAWWTYISQLFLIVITMLTAERWRVGLISKRRLLIHALFFGPVSGSPSDTNVVVLGVVVIRFSKY